MSDHNKESRRAAEPGKVPGLCVSLCPFWGTQDKLIQCIQRQSKQKTRGQHCSIMQGKTKIKTTKNKVENPYSNVGWPSIQNPACNRLDVKSSFKLQGYLQTLL